MSRNFLPRLGSACVQIRKIVRECPSAADRHTLLFSATFPPAIQQLAKEFLRPYVWIGVGRVGSTVEGIEQRIWQATAEKRAKLAQVVQALAERSGRTLVFVEKKRSATWLKKMLRNGGASDAPEAERFAPVAAEDIHGDRSQSQREAALSSFRAGSCRVLVATDVAARGLDVQGVEHVINMDLVTDLPLPPTQWLTAPRLASCLLRDASSCACLLRVPPAHPAHALFACATVCML